MEDAEIKQLFAAKQKRRLELARLPIKEKLCAVARLQEMAAPILKQRGTIVRCWKLEQLRHT
jgi:hypothetical protein